MKSEDYRMQQHDPGNTPSSSEGESEGRLKLARACLKARQHPEMGLKYIWMDTCCINKQEPNETEKAITSMFRWYSSAKVCFAYLPDVSEDSPQELEEDEHGNVIKPRVGCFESSDWFTRGWTLQELLAPKTMWFFDRYWRFLGTKDTMKARIKNVTGIEAKYLQGDVSQACMAVKMSWLARRQTKEIEDIAYCMFGLFGINTSVRYGEGEGAFLRLGQELIKPKASDESLFAWRHSKITSSGLLAPWPTCYLGSGHLTIQSSKYAPRAAEGFKVAGGGIEFQAPDKFAEAGDAADCIRLVSTFRKKYSLKLNCWDAKAGTQNTVTIQLRKEGQGNWRRVDCGEWSHTSKPRSSQSIFGPKTRPMGILQSVQGEEDWARISAEPTLKDSLVGCFARGREISAL